MNGDTVWKIALKKKFFLVPLAASSICVGSFICLPFINIYEALLLARLIARCCEYKDKNGRVDSS